MRGTRAPGPGQRVTDCPFPSSPLHSLGPASVFQQQRRMRVPSERARARGAWPWLKWIARLYRTQESACVSYSYEEGERLRTPGDLRNASQCLSWASYTALQYRYRIAYPSLYNEEAKMQAFRALRFAPVSRSPGKRGCMLAAHTRHCTFCNFGPPYSVHATRKQLKRSSQRSHQRRSGGGGCSQHGPGGL